MSMQNRWQRHILWRSERGDTIVEVLIAVGIASLVLASAYAVTNRNVQAIQQSREQAYGQKLVQQQVEYLRATPALATNAGCYTAYAAYTPDATSPNCVFKNGGAEYKIVVTPGATVQITATWDAVGGSQANITVYYRVAV